MNKYFVIWTYVANYGTMTVMADSPQLAARRVVAGFSEDFAKRGKVYVYEGDPDYTYDGAIDYVARMGATAPTV